MSALREVWVIHPPKKMKYIQWPIQLHREEETARTVLAEHHKVGCESTLTRETILTPAHAAVIEAAGVMADFIGQPPRTDSYHEWMVARNGLLAAVATLRKLEGEA
jgi:hypothetical protein